MCSHEPATPRITQDYFESSGFQNCIWGLGYYLLNPSHVVQYFACRLKERTALVNLSMKCIHQQRSAAPWAAITLILFTFDTWCKSPQGESILSWLRQMKIWGVPSAWTGVEKTYGCFPWCMTISLYVGKLSANQQQGETSCQNRHPAEVKDQGLPTSLRGLHPSASSFEKAALVSMLRIFWLLLFF